MTNNKDKKVLNVPNLRFPEFTEEWERCSLGHVTDFVKERISTDKLTLANYVSTENMKSDFGGINPAISIPNNTNVIHYKKGDVLLSNIRPYLRKVWAANSDGGCSTDVFVFRAKSISPSFLHYIMANDTFINYVMSGAKGVKMPRGDKEQMLKYVFSIPRIEEQYKISRLLHLLDDRIATQNKIIEKLQSLIKGLIDDIITLKCGQLVAFETLYSKAGEGGTPTTSNTEFYDNGSIPFIKIDDLSNKYLSANKDYITELGLKKSSAWLIPTHSIIYSNGATIGAISINKYPVCTKQGILGIVPNTNIDVEFLYYFMQSSYFQKEVERVVTEGTMKTAYLKDINHIKCPIPDLDRQKEISHFLSVLSLKEDVERQLLQKYQIQKQYLLRKMFI